MTKRIFFTLLLGGALVSAQDFKKATGYFGGGLAFGNSDFGARHNMGWGLLAGGGYKFNPHVGLNLEYNYDRFTYDYTPPPPINTIVNLFNLDGTTQVHGFNLNPRFDLKSEGPFNVYFTGGYGVYNRTFQITQPGVGTGWYCDPWWGWCTPGLVPVDFLIREYSTWKMGWNVGSGVEWGNEVKFFTEFRYRYLYTSNIRTTYMPLTFGIRF